MFGLELWFVYALLSALVGGFAAFTGKVVAQRNYSAESYILFSSFFALVFYIPLAMWFEPIQLNSASVAVLSFAFLGGISAGFKSVWKVLALRYVDTVLFFPIFKVTSPLLAIGAGIWFMDEVFSHFEWLGVVFSLMVPLLLVSRSEHTRQANLLRGLFFVLLISVFSALSISLLKFGTEIEVLALWSVVALTAGASLGTTILYSLNNRTFKFLKLFKNGFTWDFYVLSAIRGVVGQFTVFLVVLAFSSGGPLGLVYVIDSLYILIPIILSIIFYNEHWNARKVVAIILSIAALGLLK